ncbi:uncharacterized protein LOC124616060 [Schistocerca americana]|uniref:uncharacterized protein LOC124616060 n=1 Tax=Schistocerca americana TaxID=7009 RepID=UPI001F4F38CD|nr:uncharacterized protein LOC124616060 [Schistocerca americana]
MSFTVPKLAVKDSFDEDDGSDDVEDEVFIRDGRNGFKVDEERGVKRPLMAPRRKLKSTHLQNETGKVSSCKVFCVPCCYGVIALTALLGLIMLVVFLIMWFPFPLDQVAFWRLGQHSNIGGSSAPCTEIRVTDIWKKNFPKFTSESAVQLNDVNDDGIDDVIIGYGTGADGDTDPKFVCTVYFNGASPCFGGLLALDGLTGNVLWQHWAPHTVFRVDCNADVTGDKIKDCLATGKGGVFRVINGHDGSLVWHMQSQTSSPLHHLNVYTGRFIHDVDGDGVLDIVATHTEETLDGDGVTSLLGHLMLVSGRHGRMLQSVPTPGREESYYAPQILIRSDGENVVIFGTGGHNSAGGLYVVSLQELMLGEMQHVKVLYRDEFKGIMSPSVLADITHDDVEDIITAAFNSTVLAFDGQRLKMLWNYTVPNSETFSMPTPGYFNDDDTPDFLVKYQTGPGFPVYYYSQTLILDGKSGALIIDEPLIDTAGSQTGGLTISMDGMGNDVFLYWSADCLGHEKAQDVYAFMPNTPIQVQSRANICKLRFNATLITKLLALSQHLEPPGVAVYSSEDYRAFEYNNTVNGSTELQNYIDKHPDFWEMYGRQKILGKEAEFEGEELAESEPNFRSKGSSSHIPESEHKNTQDHYLRGPYQVMNRGRNRKPSSHMFIGEDEETLPSYNGNNDYPDVRKHGISLPRQHKSNSEWRHEWQNSPISTQDERIVDKHKINNYQNMNPPSDVLENSLPTHDSDYDLMYDPAAEDSLTVHPRQRDERSSQQTELNQKQKIQSSADVLGIQRLTSAGVLATPTVIASDTESIDVIFATYWIQPSPNVNILSAKQIECIEKKLQGKYFGAEKESLKMRVVKECYNTKIVEKKPEPTPFSINTGQMTVYRLRLSCVCKNTNSEDGCANVLPMYRQSWPTAAGILSTGYFKPRNSV